jgi:hypothetical protein
MLVAKSDHNTGVAGLFIPNPAPLTVTVAPLLNVPLDEETTGAANPSRAKSKMNKIINSLFSIITVLSL